MSNNKACVEQASIDFAHLLDESDGSVAPQPFGVELEFVTPKHLQSATKRTQKRQVKQSFAEGWRRSTEARASAVQPNAPLKSERSPKQLTRSFAGGLSFERRLSRPDRVGMWALLLATLLIFVAASTANAMTSLGDRTLKKGMHGHDVKQLQKKLRSKKLLHAPATGDFRELTEKGVKRFQRTRCLKVDGVAGPTTIKAIKKGKRSCSKKQRKKKKSSGGSSKMRRAKATWYGPGLWGNRTACGQKLTKNLHGVAHKTLPCGTKVRIRYNGHTVVVPVVDRGPYVDGVDFDLTGATANDLGFTGVDIVHYRH